MLACLAVLGMLPTYLVPLGNQETGRWSIESMHWILDVVFGEDSSRLRNGDSNQPCSAICRITDAARRRRPHQLYRSTGIREIALPGGGDLVDLVSRFTSADRRAAAPPPLAIGRRLGIPENSESRITGSVDGRAKPFPT